MHDLSAWFMTDTEMDEVSVFQKACLLVCISCVMLPCLSFPDFVNKMPGGAVPKLGAPNIVGQQFPESLTIGHAG